MSFPSLRELPHPGIEPRSPALADGFFTAKPPGKPREVPPWSGFTFILQCITCIVIADEPSELPGGDTHVGMRYYDELVVCNNHVSKL